MHKQAIMTLLALCLLTLSAQAQTPYGLAMHGQAKLADSSAHFAYANPNAPKGGHINRAALGSFDTLVPYTIKGKAAAGLGMITDSLMARSWDEPFTLYPLIAQSYTIAPDRSWIEFTLDPRARFHDGSPITIDDVIFSFETLKSHGRPNMRRIYAMVTERTQTAPNSIKFTFNDQHDQETALILAMMPILSQTYWRYKTFDQTTLTPPLGSGPYKIKDFEAGRSITYQRVPNYWAKDLAPRKGHHNFGSITFHYFRDDSIALEAFKSGQIDLRLEPNIARWMSAYNIPALKSGDIIKDAITHQRPVKAKGLIFNVRRAPFHDIRVRKALSLLLNEDWINKNLFYGAYQRINSYYPNSELAAHINTQDEQVKNTKPRNKRAQTRKAYKLLKEAGWVIKNGKRIHKDTQKPLSFQILLSAPEEEKIALNFKRTLEKAGINVKIQLMDSAAYRARMNEYDFDMTIYHWQSSLSPGTEQLLYFGCKAANEPARWNFPGICDPEIDKLADAIARSKSRTDLIAAAQKLDQKLMDGHYMIPLFFSPHDNYAYWQQIKRPQKVGLYGAVLETWWMDQPKPQEAIEPPSQD